MKYRKEIDGLRATAVIPVILFHAGFSQFSGGFVGVDVFFVISGYLITTIILSEKEKGTSEQALGRPYKLALQLLLATCGQRPNELTGAPLSEFDLEARVWSIPPARTKKNAGICCR